PHFIANALYLHDLWTMKRLTNWKINFGKITSDWIAELEEIDALMPVLHLRFCNPHWVFPKISEDVTEISGENLAHPLLLDQQAIPNPLYKLEKGKVLLITGSNMAGKTTYMRTVGTNILLGLCGGPCHATSLEFPPLSISCSVKNQDSLTEGISLFYAEARRLAKIFQAISENTKTYLILLDEILKGTNTKERYLASEKILTQLQGKNAFTLCTTHDLDLAKIPNIDLKHFTEKIEDNNMSFDYKIRDGVVQTTNALFILKKEGVIP
ncbi:MAG: AAA family ATPase, partial [Leptospira sp.]|nr:AAA family ATPase [Leptospira sp.]